MDVLADILAHSGVHGTLGARIEAGADWGWWSPASAGAAFHALTAGSAWVALPGREPIELVAGDILLLPGGSAHAIGSDPDALARTTPDAHDPYALVADGTVSIGRGTTRTHILCAHYTHDPAAATEVLTLLPEVVHLHAGPGSALDDTIRLLGRELARPALATEVVLDRLVDILLVGLLRAWVDEHPGKEPTPCWLGGLRDPVVRDAIERIHAEPARAWTTAALADAIAVSRATLSRRFPAVVGATPGAYLTRWRMDLAARRLRDSDEPLEAIARGVGYTSVYAFSRAFSRERSVPPGRFRTQSRQAAAA